ncbi:uncharacterized protein LOC130630347 [Hydractinia symbiolongicarpus]|uniref:uncharacterized protein LOC130630347 n=1 Tax=Hydractinia symbiolongicarpus TaxID=13093 RepID=UPI00254DCFAE|nr:uncharacterized protein LOC130630347 [Hydractinia symbiolongicarpus]
MTCYTNDYGNPPASLTWKNSSNVAAISTGKPGKAVSYTIIPVTRDSTGNYTCKANNTAGEIEKAFHFAATEKPDPPTLKIVLKSSTSIEILMTPPSYTGNKPIMYYTIHYRIHYRGKGDNALINITNLKYNIANLKPEMMCQVRAKAVNVIGEGDFSEFVNFIPGELLKTNYQNIFVIAGKSVTLKWSIAPYYTIVILNCTKDAIQIADGDNGTIAIFKDWKDNRYDVFVDGKMYGISIKNLDVSDGGVYTCRFIVRENTVVQEIMDEIHVIVEDTSDEYKITSGQTFLIVTQIYGLTARTHGVIIRIDDINKSLLLNKFMKELRENLEDMFLELLGFNASIVISQPVTFGKVSFTLSYNSNILIGVYEVKNAFEKMVARFNGNVFLPENTFQAKIIPNSTTFQEADICSQSTLRQCSKYADCKNILKLYSHACKCKDGFEGNGLVCSKNTNGKGLSKGVLIGSTAGGLAFMILIVAVCYVVCKRSKKITEKCQEKETVGNEPVYSDIYDDTAAAGNQEDIEMKSNYTELKPTPESCYTTLSKT